MRLAFEKGYAILGLCAFMDSTAIAQVAVKVVRYLPFLTSAVLLALCRIVLGPRNLRAAVLFGSAMGLVLFAWLARYFLEEYGPRAYYEVPATPENIVAIGAPGMAYDVLASAALVLAYLSVAALTALPRPPPDQAPSPSHTP
jgi:hypothetical protein